MRSLFIGILMLSLFTTGCTTKGAEVVLQSISFKQNAVTLTAGNTLQLTPVFTPTTFNGIAVEWSSSDVSLATVSSSGFLYAKQPGTVTITI